MPPQQIKVTVLDKVKIKGSMPPISPDYNHLKNLPSLNGEIIKGDKTSADYKLSYIHEQAEASDIWVVEHNLNRHPSVTIVDSADNVVIGSITYLDDNNLEIKFNGAFKGKAYLN